VSGRREKERRKDAQNPINVRAGAVIIIIIALATLAAGSAATLAAGGAATLAAGRAATLAAGRAATLAAGRAATLAAGGAATLAAGGAATLAAGGATTLSALAAGADLAAFAIAVFALLLRQKSRGKREWEKVNWERTPNSPDSRFAYFEVVVIVIIGGRGQCHNGNKNDKRKLGEHHLFVLGLLVFWLRGGSLLFV
jgi:hypothetical protein